MNDELTAQFFSYFDKKEADKKTIAKELGNNVLTIGNWRSNGIPKGKRFACRALLEAIQDKKLEELRNTMIMRPSHDQHKKWNQAALDCGQLIEDWAFEGLEKLADEHFAKKEDTETLGKAAS